ASDEGEKSTAQTMALNGCGTSGAPGAAGGTVSTGQGAFRRTFSATDPRTNRSNPPRPCVPMTIRSAGRPRASSTTFATIGPWTSFVSTAAPPALASTNRRRASEDSCRYSGESSVGAAGDTDGRPAQATSTAVSDAPYQRESIRA